MTSGFLEQLLTKEQTKLNFSPETKAEAEIRVPLKGNRNDFLEFRFRSCRNRNLVIKFGFNRILTEFKLKFQNQKGKEKEEQIYFYNRHYDMQSCFCSYKYC